MTDSPRTPLHSAILAAVRDQLQDVYTAMPGSIESFDHSTGKARVKPQIQEVQDSKGKYRPLPVVAGVPVVFPGGAAASLTMPLAVGDTGLMVFTKHALEVWLSRGGDVAPGDPRMFDLTDAVFFPGLRPFTVGSPAESATALTLKNGNAKIVLDGGRVSIGNDAGDLLDIVDQLLQLLLTSVIPTAIGPQQLSAVTSGGILELKTLLQGIKRQA